MALQLMDLHIPLQSDDLTPVRRMLELRANGQDVMETPDAQLLKELNPTGFETFRRDTFALQDALATVLVDRLLLEVNLRALGVSRP